MIYDRLENLDQYTGLFEPLDTAIAWIAEHDLNELPLGRTDIDGDKVYVTVSECATRSSDEAQFETHSTYMDLQVDLEGVELFEVSLSDLEETVAYNEENDIAFYNAELSTAAVLGPDRFVIFMTEEAHKPAVHAVGCDSVKKAVFKIARDYED